MTIGHRIIVAIAENSLFAVSHPDPKAQHVFTWSSGAAEQLDAVADAHFYDLARRLQHIDGLLEAATKPSATHVQLSMAVEVTREQLAGILAGLGR